MGVQRGGEVIWAGLRGCGCGAGTAGQAAGESLGFIAPMLPTAVVRLQPDAAEFVAEVKWDGLRACITVAGGRVRAWSRSGRDITAA